jgi:hypothetical protein
MAQQFVPGQQVVAAVIAPDVLGPRLDQELVYSVSSVVEKNGRVSYWVYPNGWPMRGNGRQVPASSIVAV